MRGVIIAGGRLEDPERIRRYLRPGDFVICADSGYDRAGDMGIVPDLIVGDMDSVKTPPVGDNVELYPPKKDFTDTELALEAALSRGCSSILLLCATGCRLDHTIANILLLRLLADAGIDGMIADEHNEIRLITASIDLTGEPGETISLIPVTDCTGVTTQGLEYPLDNAFLPLGPSRGVSNVLLGDAARVSVAGGYLLVLRSRDEPPSSLSK